MLKQSKEKFEVFLMSDRVDVGIPGMNEILYGGIPRRNIVLLSCLLYTSPSPRD